MNTLQDAWRVARFDLGTAIRTKRAVVALLIYVGGALMNGALLVSLEEQFGDKLALARASMDAAAAMASVQKDAPGVYESVEKIVGGDPEFFRFVLHLPLVVLGFFLTTLSVLPWLVALVSHDLVNSEVRNRSVRFVLLRTSREALLAGKMLSHGLLFLLMTLAATAALFLYAWSKLPSLDVLATALLLLRFWALAVVYGFCWMSLTALVSSLVDGAGLALVVNVAALIGLLILWANGSVGFLSPMAWVRGLWSPHVAELAVSSAVLVAFGAGFLALAWARLRWRDL